MARKTYTDEEKAAFQAKTDALIERADAIIEDPHGEAMTAINSALPRASERIQRYSLRNQVLLFTQAADLGLNLAEVATPKQWGELGRKIHPDHKWNGLRIVTPRGSEDVPVNDGKGGVAVKERVYFRMISVFDIAQTVAA